MPRQGIIISSDSCNNDGPYRFKVLELDVADDEDPHVVRFIHESAFQVPTTVVDMVERKNLQRRLDMPLLYGDIISWNEIDVLDNQVKAITKFKREKTLYQVRTTGHGCEVLLRGAINPMDRLHIYTNMFRKLIIPAEQLKVGMPNVYFNVWVEIKADYDTCTVSLAEFDSVCDVEMQEELITLPWNSSNNTYITRIRDSDSEDEHPWLMDSTYEGPAQELFGRAAFVSGPRTFFCGEHSNKMFVIPILKKDDPASKIGVQLRIDAIYNRFEDVYLVSKVYKPPTFVSEPIDDQGRLRCSVQLTNFPGIFYNKELGFMDDPDGKLSLIHLITSSTKPLQVTVADSGPSHSAKGRFRFRIVDLIATAKECRIQKWLSDRVLDNKPIILSDENGTVVSQTHVFCPKHPTLRFRLPYDEEIVPGKMVTFTAQFNVDADEFLISSMEYLPNIALNYVVRRMFEHCPYEKQFIFQITKARLPDRADVPPLLCCDHFGFIDDLGLIKEVKKNKQYTVWVMLSSPDFKDAYRPARVAFEVVSASNKEPSDRVTAQCGNRILDKIQGELLDSGSESCFSSWSEPLTVYSEQKPPSEYRAVFTEDDRTLCDQMTEGMSSEPIKSATLNPSRDNGTRVKPTLLPSTSRQLSISERNSVWSRAYDSSTEDGNSSATGGRESYNAVQMAIDEINQFPHNDECGEICVRACPFLKALSTRIVKTPDFWAKCILFPDLAASVSKKLQFEY